MILLQKVSDSLPGVLTVVDPVVPQPTAVHQGQGALGHGHLQAGGAVGGVRSRERWRGREAGEGEREEEEQVKYEREEEEEVEEKKQLEENEGSLQTWTLRPVIQSLSSLSCQRSSQLPSYPVVLSLSGSQVTGMSHTSFLTSTSSVFTWVAGWSLPSG